MRDQCKWQHGDLADAERRLSPSQGADKHRGWPRDMNTGSAAVDHAIEATNRRNIISPAYLIRQHQTPRLLLCLVKWKESENVNFLITQHGLLRSSQGEQPVKFAHHEPRLRDVARGR